MTFLPPDPNVFCDCMQYSCPHCGKTIAPEFVKNIVDEEFNKRFFKDRDNTGRYMIHSVVTGKKYYVESIDNSPHHKLWGDLNVATGKVEGEYGTKYKGSITLEETLITQENGFKNICDLEPGESPNDFMLRIDKKYEEENKDGKR